MRTAWKLASIAAWTSVLAAQEPAGPAPAPAAAVALPADVVDDELLLQQIEAGCERLRRAGDLRAVAALREGADGRRCAVAPLPVRSGELSPVDLRALLVPSTWIVGHYYHCDECDAYHFTASSGFALAQDGVLATCFHLLDDDAPQGEKDPPPTLLAVADWQGHVYPVTEVLAADRAADVAVLRCTAKDLVPLPVRADVRAGESIWCLSNPDHMFASFSAGLVARRYLLRGAAPGTEGDVAVPEHAARVAPGPARLFLQVTCDFGSGSSGGPIVDACGNLVGLAQSTATVLVDPDAVPAETQMVARTAAPSSALLALLRR